MELVHETFYPISADVLFDMHARPEALRRLSPAFPPVRTLVQDGEFEPGTTVRIEIGVGPLAISWVAGLEMRRPVRLLEPQRLQHAFTAGHGMITTGCQGKTVVRSTARSGARPRAGRR